VKYELLAVLRLRVEGLASVEWDEFEEEIAG
jgi:hypothetical protein